MELIESRRFAPRIVDFHWASTRTWLKRAIRGDLFLQQLASSRESLPDGLLGQFKRLGDPLDGMILPVKEDQGFAIGLWYLFQGTPENGLLLVSNRALDGQLVSGRGLHRGFERCSALSRFPLQGAAGISDDSSGDAAQPGPELPRLPQRLQMCPGGDEGFLGDVLALGQVASRAVSDRGDERLVASDNLSEGLAVAVQASVHQGKVTACFCPHGSKVDRKSVV